jgi:hypothetical protein
MGEWVNDFNLFFLLISLPLYDLLGRYFECTPPVRIPELSY